MVEISMASGLKNGTWKEESLLWWQEKVLQPGKWNTWIQTKSNCPIHIVHIGSSQLYSWCVCAIGTAIKDRTFLRMMWLSFFSLCHGVMWLFSWRTPNLNIPKIVVFRTYHITHESVQSDDFCVEVSGCCRLHTRQSMPYSAQVPGAASLAGSRLGGTSCHGPWWWEPKCLSSWIWRWDQQQMRHDLYMIRRLH